MDDFITIYKILKVFHASMKCEDFDEQLISPEHFGIERAYWAKLLEILADEGLVKGIGVKKAADGIGTLISFSNPRITLKGLEYLEENTFMKRTARLLKGIKEIIPGD